MSNAEVNYDNAADLSPEGVIEQVSESLQRCNLTEQELGELAAIIGLSIEHNPKHLPLRICFAEFVLHATGDSERALELLMSAHEEDVENSCPQKWLLLGQMTAMKSAEFEGNGDEINSMVFSQKAADFFAQGKKYFEANISEYGAKLNYVTLCLSLVDLFMSPPSCDLETAASTVEQNIEAAIATDSDSFDAHAALSKYLYATQEYEKCEESIKKCLSIAKVSIPVEDEEEVSSIPEISRDNLIHFCMLLIEFDAEGTYTEHISLLSDRIKNENADLVDGYWLDYMHEFRRGNGEAIKDSFNELLSKANDYAAMTGDTVWVDRCQSMQ